MLLKALIYHLNCSQRIVLNMINVCIQDSEGAYYWHITSGTIQRHPPLPDDSQVSWSVCVSEQVDNDKI